MFDSMGSYGEGPEVYVNVVVKTDKQLEEERLAQKRHDEKITNAVRQFHARVALGEKNAKEKGNTVSCKRCYYAETHPFTGEPWCDLPDYVGDEVADAYAKEKGVYISYLMGSYRRYRLLNVDRDCRYFRRSNMIKQLFKQVKQVFNLE